MISLKQFTVRLYISKIKMRVQKKVLRLLIMLKITIVKVLEIMIFCYDMLVVSMTTASHFGHCVRVLTR